MNTISVLFSSSKGTAAPELFGHFTEHIGGVIYDGIYVGEDSDIENVRGFRKSLLDRFKTICPPVIRWPGGAFAEVYDWRDGIGPKELRPKTLNWWTKKDGKAEPHAVGTHEFMDFCSLTGAQPYFAANMTTVSPLHIRNWMEYCLAPEGSTTLAKERAANGHPTPFDIKYWGIGNENWGGGGNMDPVTCAREYLRYSTICSSIPGNKYLIACGANNYDLPWTRGLLSHLSRHHLPDGMSVHLYACTEESAEEFDEEQWYATLFKAAFMNKLIRDHRSAMDEFDPDRKVKLIIDEWGCWHSYGKYRSCPDLPHLYMQQSNMRDALVSILSLHAFINACDVVHMANVAQLCNNLHALFLCKGKAFTVTPTYHIFDMLKGHQGGKQLNLLNDCSCRPFNGVSARRYEPLQTISAAATLKGEVLTLSLANTSLTESAVIRLNGVGRRLSGNAVFRVLTADDPHTCNTFDEPDRIAPKETTITLRDGDSVIVPAASAAVLTLHLQEENA